MHTQPKDHLREGSSGREGPVREKKGDEERAKEVVKRGPAGLKNFFSDAKKSVKGGGPGKGKKRGHREGGHGAWEEGPEVPVMTWAEEKKLGSSSTRGGVRLRGCLQTNLFSGGVVETERRGPG